MELEDEQGGNERVQSKRRRIKGSWRDHSKKARTEYKVERLQQEKNEGRKMKRSERIRKDESLRGHSNRLRKEAKWRGRGQ